jgi:predicted metalloendopeptidase
MLAEKTSQQVRDLIRNAASAHAPKGSVVQEVGGYYASVLDRGGIEAKGLSPLAGEVIRIAAITDSALRLSRHDLK